MQSCRLPDRRGAPSTFGRSLCACQRKNRNRRPEAHRHRRLLHAGRRSRGFESMTPLLRRRSDQAEASLRSFPRAQESTRKAIGHVVGFGLALSVPVSHTGMVQYPARRFDYLVSAAQVLARSKYVGSSARRDRNRMRLRDDQRTARIENWRRWDIWHRRDLRLMWYGYAFEAVYVVLGTVLIPTVLGILVYH